MSQVLNLKEGSKQFLNVKEVSAWIGLSESLIRAHTAGRKHVLHPVIPCIRVGRRIVYNRDTIAGWMKQIEDFYSARAKSA